MLSSFRLVAVSTLTLVLLAPPLVGRAHADSTRLWAERGAQDLPLSAVPDFRTLAGQVVPAVVSIATEQKPRSRGRALPGMPDGNGPQDPLEFFHRFFGGEMPREYRNRGLGSGFVVDVDGHLLTNYHVVEDADVIEVTLTGRDGTDHKVMAKVLGTAPEYDVALLKTQEPLPDATIAYLGDSETTQIGDWVMAVGNPFGLSHSVSVGIISAKERRDVAPSGRQGIYNFLQTDASINPGNSGGPLVNMRGEVIGINSAINAAGSGIGFAIPINMVKAMLPDLKSKGRYARSWIGIRIQPLNEELAKSLGLARPMGALVAELVPGGPGAEAKLQEGDVILSFDGKDIRSASDLPLLASSTGVGRAVPLRVWRGGREVAATVKLSEFPDSEGELAGRDAGQEEAGPLGLQVGELTPALRQQLGIEAKGGAVVRGVADGGVAARAGLRPGDVITSVDGRPTPSRRAVVDSVRQVKRGALFRMRVVRGGSGLFLALRKP
jgi:serine protease Do